MTELILPRRKFLVGTATLITAAYAGPAIVRAASLMDINTLQNRLVVGYTSNTDPKQVLNLSMLNAASFINKEAYEAWKERCSYNTYQLVRRAEIQEDHYFCDPEEARNTKIEVERYLEHAIHIYRGRGTYRGLTT